jgi:hypothetical protein
MILTLCSCGGVASVFIPRLGIVQEYRTSMAEALTCNCIILRYSGACHASFHLQSVRQFYLQFHRLGDGIAQSV